MRLTFGDFSLDLDTRQLLQAGDEIHLSPKAFELLVILVEERPRAMAKNELVEKLWPSTFVTEGNLSVLVAEIRRALGDSARAAKFVRTVQRFGYAFIGEVQASSDSHPKAGTRTSHWLICGRQRFELAEGVSIVGRDPHCEIVLDLPGVSRHHVRLQMCEGGVTIEDLGSKNGTLRNEEPLVELALLEDRDRLRLGPAMATYRCWSGPGTTATMRTKSSA
jgi:DNA-binding winged helix-turn-helix (wHTH) protein